MYNVLNKLSEYIYTFTWYKKTWLHALLLLVFKFVESLQYILKVLADLQIMLLLKEPQTITMYWIYLLHNHVDTSTKSK